MITTHELALAASINLENAMNGYDVPNNAWMVHLALEEIAGRLD
jgi:hypothetical protein